MVSVPLVGATVPLGNTGLAAHQNLPARFARAHLSPGQQVRVLWWMRVVKARFIPAELSAQTIRAEKKRTRQARRRTWGRPG
jgi:hypothetical protein